MKTDHATALRLESVSISVKFTKEMARGIQDVAVVHKCSYSEAIRKLCRAGLALRKQPSVHGIDDATLLDQ